MIVPKILGSFHAGLYLGGDKIIHMAPLYSEVFGEFFNFTTIATFMGNYTGLMTISPKIQMLSEQDLYKRATEMSA